jgi:hypothetical protein
LKARRSVLAARLELTPKEASFRAEIQKEFNAIKWAIEQIEARLVTTT